MLELAGFFYKIHNKRKRLINHLKILYLYHTYLHFTSIT